jgi:hypothetical protein
MAKKIAVKVSTCRWFLKCGKPATGTQPHPVLGDVPICSACAAWLKSVE